MSAGERLRTNEVSIPSSASRRIANAVTSSEWKYPECVRARMAAMGLPEFLAESVIYFRARLRLPLSRSSEFRQDPFTEGIDEGFLIAADIMQIDGGEPDIRVFGDPSGLLAQIG
jgi:hypothetical protein